MTSRPPDTRRLGPDLERRILERLPPLARAIFWRRSFRAYADLPFSPDQERHIRKALELALSLDGRRSGWGELLASDPDKTRVLKALTSGLLGRTNLWLRRSRPAGLVLLHGDETRSVHEDGRWHYNVDVALAGQSAVLAAAELGVGSCWMAAIDETACRKELDLPRSRRIVAAIAFGTPRQRVAMDLPGLWDRLARRLVSSRRKPLSDICSLERFGTHALFPDLDLAHWPSGTKRLGVVELLERALPWSEVSGPTPSEIELAWLCELCRQAPTADNSQIWRLVVLRNPGTIRRVLEAASAGRPELQGLADQEPGALVVFAAAPFLIRHRTQEQPFALIDVPIGMLHVLLGAEEMGLAWNALVRFSHELVGRTVDLPSDHQVVGLLLLGRSGRREGHKPWIQLWRREESGQQ